MTTDTLPDEERVIHAAQQDTAAFAPLYRHYVTPVYRYLYHRVGNTSDAEDLTAQVFLEALRGLPRYRHHGHFAGWLFTIARRRAADHYRSQPVLLPLDELVTPSDSDDPLTQAALSQRLDRLHDVIGDLADGDLELLRLRYAAGLTLAQMGHTLGLREGAVKMRLHRLLARLQHTLEGEP